MIIMQSCFSGASFDNQLGSFYFKLLAGEILGRATEPWMHLSILTPVTKHIPSPVNVWENILSEAILKDTYDGFFITYSDFKDRIYYHSCKNDQYVPEKLWDHTDQFTLPFSSWYGGISPKFFEIIPPNLPVFLTDQGVEARENKEIIDFPPLEAATRNVSISEETMEFCNRQDKQIMHFFLATKEDIQKLLEDPTVSKETKYKYYDTIRSRNFSQQDKEDLLNIAF